MIITLFSDHFHVEILDYPVFLKLGILEREKLLGQTVYLSFWVSVPSFGPISDLKQTVDYGALLKKVDVHLEGRNIGLIEEALQYLGQALMIDFPCIQQLKIKLYKPVIPEGLAKGAQVSISMTFDRSIKS